MSRKFEVLAVFAVSLLCLAAGPLRAQGNSQNVDLPDQAAVLVPGSSIELPEDVGRAAHTNHVILFRSAAPQATSPSGMSPANMYSAYSFTASGGRTIAIVDAYDYPIAQNDLAVFSSTFGLPPANFQVVYATPGGKAPRANCGWAQEAALDIEWARAMAPGAKIVLVEAASNSFSDLLKAVDVASGIVAAGDGQVSMSWGGSEFSSETSYDSHFNNTGVVYFAASGDSGGKTIWPGVSPNAVSAGGTTLNLSSTGAFISETGWSGSGGGPSKYEVRPSYQHVIQSTVGSQRGAPDFSFDANPYTGVSVYDTTSCQGMSGWMVFGGTSAAFQAPGTGIFGNAPRTICCGPGLISIDLSVQKRFAITEHVGLSFRTDVYNLPNRPNFALPNLKQGNANFGRITSIVGGGRVIQLALRLQF